MSDNIELNCTNCCVGDFKDCGFCNTKICKEYKAVGNADDFIKAVQNKVLDKIRAEIEERKLNSGGEPNRALAFNVCLQIINKYRGE